MAYQKQTWKDLPDKSTPITASRLSHLETQFDHSKSYTDQALSGIESPLSVTVRHGSFLSSGVICNTFILSTGGSHVPGAVGKRVTTGGLTGFKTPLSFADDFGDPFVSNGSGWDTVTGRVRGPNFVDGVPTGSLSTGPTSQDNGAVAYCSDGQLRYYEAALGDSVSGMVSDGALFSWSWGPALVLNGAPYDYSISGGWGGLASSVKSARTVLGQLVSGDLFLLQCYGSSGQSGLSVPEVSSALSGFPLRIAVLLDGGGSTSSVWGGRVAHASSDPEDRKLPDTISFSGAKGNALYIPPVVVQGTGAYTGPLSVSLLEGEATVRGELRGSRINGSEIVVPAGGLPPFVRTISASGAINFATGKTGLVGVTDGSALRIIHGYTDGANNPDVRFSFAANRSRG